MSGNHSLKLETALGIDGELEDLLCLLRPLGHSSNLMNALQVTLIQVSHRVHEATLATIDQPWKFSLAPRLHLNFLAAQQQVAMVAIESIEVLPCHILLAVERPARQRMIVNDICD